MKTYEITIGIPVYNVEKYIRQTMDSVLAQTFESLEILICDDCGTDGSMDIVREYQQSHPRGKDIRILKQVENKGIGVGRNLMISEAKGRFFYSMDGDDTIVPNAIELLFDAACKNQAELVYGSYERVYVENDMEVGRRQYPYPSRIFTNPDEYADYAYHVGVQGMNWNFLLSMDVIRRYQLKVTEVGHGYGEDFTYTVDLPTYVTRVVLLSDITYQYYNRDVKKLKPRKILSRANFEMSIKALDKNKHRFELKGKHYYSERVSKVMMYACSFACEMIARRKDFDVPFSNREVRDVMWHPMTLWEILNSKSGRFHNLVYWIIGNVPLFLTVMLLKLMALRYKK